MNQYWKRDLSQTTPYKYTISQVMLANTGDAAGDALYGGTGDDWIISGAGDDFADGGADNDTLLSNNGNDVINGDSANLTPAQQGNDFLDGGDLLTVRGTTFGQVRRCLDSLLINGAPETDVLSGSGSSDARTSKYANEAEWRMLA